MQTIRRSSRIFSVLLRHIFNPKVLPHTKRPLRFLMRLNPFSYRYPNNRAEALRITLETLGPVFIKFGQMLSLRNDVLPNDITHELEKLQDNTTPFDGAHAEKIIEQALGKPINSLFNHFDSTPLAAASVAQVHSAQLKSGENIVIKVIRPDIKTIIDRDLKLMHRLAQIIQRCFSLGKQLRPIELVAEFKHTIHNELNLQYEAANASLLRRNFAQSDLMYVPEIYWDYCRSNVMVMERIYATKISDRAALKNKKVDFKKLAENGVKIFFTQLLEHNFFHADMHPGNLFIDTSNPQSPQYVGVDFGIMGQLNENDLSYVAQNFLAFFNRDYQKIARLFIQAGWVPADTRLEHLEAAIRTTAEPLQQKSLQDLSLGALLTTLLDVARTYHMSMQPQLLLLKKTLLNIEALGRNLYPDLDLWNTAQPFLAQWEKRQHSPKNMIKTFQREWQPQLQSLIKLPQQMDQYLKQRHKPPATNKPKRYWLSGTCIAFGGVISAFYPQLIPFTLILTGMAFLI
jgi:ubiquinone biosynthesis protein